MPTDSTRTTWQVKKVTETPGRTVADLVRVEWFKRNPEYDRLMADDTYDGDMPGEFIDAGPGEASSFCSDLDDYLSLDITDGPALHPGDDVYITIEAPDAG